MSGDRVPVLMYHAVGLPTAGAQGTFLNVSAASFERQVRALAALGYRARPFGDVLEAWQSGRSLPARTVALTFDDAYRCVGDVAAPIMKAAGMAGTLFVVSAWAASDAIIGQENGRIAAPTLGWDGLAALERAGWEIAGHTATHAHLDALGDGEQRLEICEGKREVEARLGITLRSFCYPFGHLNARTPELVRGAGFLGACTVRSGIAARGLDPYMLPRVKIAHRDGVMGMLYRMLVRPHLPTLRRHRRPLAGAPGWRGDG